MSDFSELCPIFNTGVFHELIFPNIKMTDISASGNALLGSTAQEASSQGDYTFGRTVVVTDAWVRKVTTPGTKETITLRIHGTKNASGTAFGTLVMSKTVTGYAETHGYFALNVTDQTFTSAAVLGLAYGTATAATGGVFDLMIRYKEK